MKKKQTRSAFSNLHVLIGLVAVGVLMAVFARYAGGRTSTSAAPRQRTPSNPSGIVTEAWVRRIDGPVHGSDHGHAVATDSAGNVFTTGFESDGFSDGEFITLKFNSSGVLQWAMPYNGSTSSIDYANCIVVDGDGNSYITGWSGGGNNLHDMTTIKYDPDGNEL